MMRSKSPAPAGMSKPSPSITSTLSIAELLEPGPGAVGQRPVALDGQHVPAQPRQDRGLVAGAGADLEHLVVLLQLQLLGHVGDHEGLADGLAAGDAERAVAVGMTAVDRPSTNTSRGTSSMARSTAWSLIPRRRRLS